MLASIGRFSQKHQRKLGLLVAVALFMWSGLPVSAHHARRADQFSYWGTVTLCAATGYWGSTCYEDTGGTVSGFTYKFVVYFQTNVSPYGYSIRITGFNVQEDKMGSLLFLTSQVTTCYPGAYNWYQRTISCDNYPTICVINQCGTCNVDAGVRRFVLCETDDIEIYMYPSSEHPSQKTNLANCSNAGPGYTNIACVENWAYGKFT